MKTVVKPDWLKWKMSATKSLGDVRRVLKNLSLNTVCEEAHCPNRNLCYSNGQATFLIMGDVCSRNCRFCAISNGDIAPLDADEPRRVANAAEKMKLKYIVITSVTRDDLPDGGAAHFAETIRQVRRKLPDAGIEVLTPDFLGDKNAIETVLAQKPDVFNHNVETIPRLYSLARPQANYQRSLMVLKFAGQNSDCIIKSGFMVGLGESDDEIFMLLRDLKDAGVNIITIGQYLQPSPQHIPVERFVRPEKFDEYAEYGENVVGFDKIFAGPLVRSSFMAEDIWKKMR